MIGLSEKSARLLLAISVLFSLPLHGAGSIGAISDGTSNRTAAVPDYAEDPAIMIFPQFADGGGYKTNFLLTNATTTDTIATLTFHSDTGAPLDLTIGGATASSHPIFLPAQGSAKVTTSGVPASAVVGWASVTTSSSVKLNGTAVFQFFNDQGLFSEASVPAVLPVSTVDFYAEEEGGFRTGFALANPGATTAQGMLTLRRLDGTVFDTRPISVKPGNHVATYLWQIFGERAPSGRAEIALTSGCLAATALRYHTSSVFSTVSVGQPGFAGAGVAVMFSPNGGVRNRLIAEIDKAESTIDIAIYSFTADQIRDALTNARDRGVQIRIIADMSQANGPGSEISRLEQLGFQVKRSSGLLSGIMHNKYMIIDSALLFTGSYNWSASAEDNNFENALFIQGSTAIRDYIADFQQIWTR
ncbi:MAG: hypothetical protein LAP85_13570 [Acidobacteriia bacterium]|nr:hypothetical protein [Terriglobia bacterium]